MQYKRKTESRPGREESVSIDNGSCSLGMLVKVDGRKSIFGSYDYRERRELYCCAIAVHLTWLHRAPEGDPSRTNQFIHACTHLLV